MGAWMLCSSLFLSVGLRNRQLLQVTFCRCAHFGAGKLNEILTVDFGNHCPARHRRRRSYRAACIAAFHMTGIEQSDAGSLTAICREIGRAIIPALFFWFDVGQHHPRNPRSAMAVTMIFLGNSSFMAIWRSGDLKRHAEDSSHRNSAKQYEPTHTFA